VIDIDSYRFIEPFSDIDFYRLPSSGLSENKTMASDKLHGMLKIAHM